MFRPSTRRRLLRDAVVTGFALPVVLRTTTLAFAQVKSDDAQIVPTEKLMAEGPLPDMWIGSKDAPVTIIEYASMTCPHCAAFHAETWPTLKSKYIDTGKVRFVLREFPLDPLATAGFMLARCAGPDKRNAMTDLLFDQQKNWAFVDKPVDALAATVKQAGISQAQFESCLKDQKLYDQVNQTRDKASTDLKIDATPTFFINGRKYAGELSVAQIDKDIDEATKK
ncbi:DsbA family protein [Hyphomicrobiales bacterium BP6-180914]|uniref:DsbA family protein n=2 Tax=Lichenifustis flavocetrariae TaxID=2949735 RepID=A0AA41YZU4_9HYPH|nr:DsbA family protein [Lichenifustis flavocetrariae]MCW6510153.1 DsbA family protein [Lichenifustis flavocetrariae]